MSIGDYALLAVWSVLGGLLIGRTLGVLAALIDYLGARTAQIKEEMKRNGG